ncbi:MAG: DUF1269 domain-containing protein [Schwartzia sp.]|nr:DUF1269 domain-containing protein [Schwartzia sp. (in: firmicutes)]
MDNVVTAIFEEENEAYRAFSEIKPNMVGQTCIIAQLALLKKKDGHILMVDGADSGVTTKDDTRLGGLIGLVVGVLGGPLGMLFGGAMGSLIGRMVDAEDARQGISMIEQVSSRFQDGDVALVALARENDETMLDAMLSPYKATVIRHDAAVVAAEVEEAMKVQEAIAAEALQKMREAKKAEIREKIVQKGEEIRAEFEKRYS